MLALGSGWPNHLFEAFQHVVLIALPIICISCFLLLSPGYAQASSAQLPNYELHQYRSSARREIKVKNANQLVEAVKKVLPGDLVVLEDGTYKSDDTLSLFNKRGSEDNPIVIVAENRGKAVLSGTLRFDISYSSYITIAGLTFNTKGAGPQGDLGAIQLRNTHHARIARNYFALAEEYDANPSVMLDWVVIRGKQSQYNRVDHNRFENKLQRGRFLIIGVLTATDTMPQHTLIDHNYFKHMAPIGKNGMEAIVIGGGHPQSAHLMADQDAYTVFEHNLLDSVDGECAEIISLKSSSNAIRYNTIINTTGSIYFRAGNRNTVHGNYFLGNGKIGSGGVRLYGEDQKVTDNYFYNLDIPSVWIGDGNAEYFDPKTNIAPFTQVIRAKIAYNRFIENNVSIARHQREASPFMARDLTIANNTFYSTLSGDVIDPLLFDLPKVNWQGNTAFAPKSALAAELGRTALTPLQIRMTDRDEQPDMDVLEHLIYPLQHRPLQPDDIGPEAIEHVLTMS